MGRQGYRLMRLLSVLHKLFGSGFHGLLQGGNRTSSYFLESVNQIKKYMGADHEDVKAMEADLAKLKADNGKGEFVIYKGAFMVSTETTVVAFNPTIVMRPDLAKSAEELTAENYRKDMEEVTKLLAQAVKDKTVTSEQKEAILKKMNENLANLN